METSTPAPDARQVRRSRIQLLLIFALFLLPPLSAWVAWQYLGEEGGQQTTNAGTLVSPARPLTLSGLQRPDGAPLGDDALRGRWTYVLFAAGGCDARCEEQLYLTRQTRLAMNKDIPRVQRLMVFGAAPGAALAARLAEEHADLTWVVDAGKNATGAGAFRGPGFAPDGRQFFLVDPLGNLMMFYGSDVPAKGMMKDLQKLLKISQIG